MANNRRLGSAATSLARVISGGAEPQDPLQLRTATIVEVSKAATPWTVTINLGNTLISGVTILGWTDPRVGEVVQCLKQGPLVFVLGAPAPGRTISPTATIPTPPAVPQSVSNPVPPAQLTTREVSIPAISSSTWAPGAGAWRDDVLFQGGQELNRAFFFYSTRIADAVGTATILAGTILLRRKESDGVEQAQVRIGTHNLALRPAAAPPAATSAFAGTLQRGQGKSIPLSDAQIAALNGKTATGFVLSAVSAGLKSPEYVNLEPVGLGTEWSGTLSLTVRG